MVLTLYKLEPSPPARAVMMVIEALGIPDVKFVDVNLIAGDHLKEEYLKINPQHTVPTLTDDDFNIWDSHAIAAYLVTKYGKNDALHPTDPKKRALVDQRLHFDSAILFPSIRQTVAPIFYGSETAYAQENLDKITAGYDLTEKFLTQTWIAGDSMTIADICCAASVSSMNAIIPIDAEKYPKITNWLKRISQEEFYKKRNVSGVEMLKSMLESKLKA